MTGIVKRLIRDKGFGFIESGKSEFFFHRSALKNMNFEDLQEGQEVTFEEGEGTKGPRAEDIYVYHK